MMFDALPITTVMVRLPARRITALFVPDVR